MMAEIKNSNVGLVILAAGLGKRMKSSVPKTLNVIAGKPMIYHLLEQVSIAIPSAHVAIVVGQGREQVEAYIREENKFKDMKIEFVHQTRQLGTGHALRCAMESSWGMKFQNNHSTLLVLPGDFPLLSSGIITNLLAPFLRGGVMRLLTCELKDPTGYGRVIRQGKGGAVRKIVEEKDASPKEKLITEVATSIYLFSSRFLNENLKKISNRNAQEEYYLTDLVGLASKSKKKVEVLKWKDSEDVKGVNDQWELSQASRILNLRILKKWGMCGVRVLNPDSTTIDITVELGEGVVLYPGVILSGETKIGNGCIIESHVVLRDVQVGDRTVIKTGTVAERSSVGADNQIGPYAHLRPGSDLGDQVKIGNFVELKKTKVANSTSVAHLSYLGDAEVGQNVNIGCGFVTCNYDGRVVNGERKHRTIIEDNVFMGSDCQTVAPVRIGKGAFVASGSTITEDVPSEALAIGRARQVNKPGYAKKLKGGN